MSLSTRLLPGPGETAPVFVDGPAGRLETVIAMPRGNAGPRGTAVICHPHPLFGGAMTNKVVWMLAAAAGKAGLATARFNFRGVGRSTGLYDESRGETEDALAVVSWMEQRLPGPLLLAGFSFGAYVALKAATRVRPAALVTIAVPFGRYVDGADAPRRPECPWLAVHSTDDDTVAYADTRRVLDAYVPPPAFARFEGAGHFFHGRLTELQQLVQPFIADAIGTAVGTTVENDPAAPDAIIAAPPSPPADT